MQWRRFVRSVPWSFALCVACALAVSLPMWTHRWLPIQDLPQHLATLRVVHDAHTGGATSPYYAIDLFRTQYILFYVLGDLLCYAFSARAVGVIVLTLYVVGTVTGTYALLRSLGRDPRLSILTLPLVMNSQLVLGLLQFLIGVPLMLYGWSLALDYMRSGRRRLAVGLAIVAVLIFYSHVVVFGIFIIGLIIVAPLREPRRLVRLGLPLVPAGLLLARWVLFTEAGDFVRNAVVADATDKDLWPFAQSFHEMYRIAFDTYRDSADEKCFATALCVGLVLTVLARGKGPRSIVSTARWLIIPVVCIVLYFRSEGGNGYLAHIRDRFPLLAAFALVPALRMPRGIVGHLGTVAMVVVAFMTGETLNWHLDRFVVNDVGDFDDALAHIPANKRVAGLIYQSESTYFAQNPFLHFPSYYLAEKGGVVNFSFAGYPHWVYAYRPHQDALGASPPVFTWEWRPDRVDVREELAASYDYVLTRGGGFDPPENLFAKVWDGSKWAVWERRSK